MKTLGSFAAFITRWLALALPVVLAACGGGSDAPAAQGMGTLRLALTDAPACGYDAVYVTVQKVRVHQSSSAGDSDAGWSEIQLNPARRVDLLSLRNGALEELGQTTLPAGKYTQMRLVLAPNDGATPIPNSVMPSGAMAEAALTTPSGQQSGIKLNVNIAVEPEKVAYLVLDFDACKSVVRAGNSGRYNLKPVISVTPVISSVNQRVIGYVDTAIAGSARVSLQKAAGDVVDVVKSTLPMPSGEFVLFPVPVGTYDLVVATDGRATAVLTGVPVTDTAVTFANAASAPINPPPSTMRDAKGTVKVGTTEVAATVLATQTLDGGAPKVEVAWQEYQAGLAYSFSLPASAPQRAAFAASGVPTFSPAASAAGKYALTARVPGKTDITEPIDFSLPPAPIDFMFP